MGREICIRIVHESRTMYMSRQVWICVLRFSVHMSFKGFKCAFERRTMGWLRLVGSLKLYVSFAKEPYKRDDLLQKRPIIWRSLLIVATPYLYWQKQMLTTLQTHMCLKSSECAHEFEGAVSSVHTSFKVQCAYVFWGGWVCIGVASYVYAQSWACVHMSLEGVCLEVESGLIVHMSFKVQFAYEF